MTHSRRSFITGLAAFIAAPAVVRVTSLMPMRGIVMDAGIKSLRPSRWLITSNPTHWQDRWWWVENNVVHYGPLLGFEL